MTTLADDDVRAWVAVSIAAWRTTAPWIELLGRFGMDAGSVVGATTLALRSAGAQPKAIDALRTAWRDDSLVALRGAARLGLGIATMASPQYPPLLREIADPPLVLYWRGRAPVECDPAVAIVGSRRCSDYGRRIATRLGQSVASAGAVVVSGLARGIDAAAHRGALDGGVTGAVLAGGLDHIYPAEHRSLAERILDHGGWILSEQPPGRSPIPRLFPYRNRIITGLSRATVVVEAGHKSGSLASVHHALGQGREVFVVPGPIDSPYSIGTNALAREGCTLLTAAKDLACVSGLAGLASASTPEGSRKAQDFKSLADPAGRAILTALHQGRKDLDGLVDATSLDDAKLLAFLTALELDGLIERGWDGMYSCTALAPVLPSGARSRQQTSPEPEKLGTNGS